MNKTRFWISACLLVVLSGCGGISNTKRMSILQDSIDIYVQSLRWARLDEAASYHVRRDGTKIEVDLAPMETVRVTGYSIKDKDVNDDYTEATVTGELNYYHTEYGTLKKIPLEQKWWFQQETGKWLLESDFPKFK